MVPSLRRADGALNEHWSRREESMIDVLYMVGTVAFFGAMAAYGRACEALGKDGGEDHRT